MNRLARSAPMLRRPYERDSGVQNPIAPGDLNRICIQRFDRVKYHEKRGIFYCEK